MAGTDPAAAEARAFIRKYGGALTAPSWAKFWLCVLGVHEWEVLYMYIQRQYLYFCIPVKQVN